MDRLEQNGTRAVPSHPKDAVLLAGQVNGYRGTAKNLLAYTRIFANLIGNTRRVVVLAGSSVTEGTIENLISENFWVERFGNPKEMATIVRRCHFSIDGGFTLANIHNAGHYISAYSPLLKVCHELDIPVALTNVFGRNDYFTGRYIDVNLHISLWDLSRWNARRFCPFLSTGRLGIYLPNAVDTTAFTRSSPVRRTEFRRCIGVPEEAFVLGRIGKTDWRVFIPAIKSFLAKYEKAHLISVADYAFSQQNQMCFKNLPEGLSRRCHVVPLLKSSEALSDFYSSCDCMAATSSVGESFGFVVAEAMACECPVVSFCRPSMDNAQLEMIADPDFIAGKGKDLFLAFDKAYKRIQKDPDIGKKFRATIVDRYDISFVQKELATLLDAVHEARKGNGFDRHAFHRFLRQRFETKFTPSLFHSLRYIFASVGTQPSIREIFSYAWRRQALSFFLYERLRVLLEHKY